MKRTILTALTVLALLLPASQTFAVPFNYQNNFGSYGQTDNFIG